jgi:hypothetical protein
MIPGAAALIHSVREGVRVRERKATSGQLGIALMLSLAIATLVDRPGVIHLPVVLMLSAMALLAECLPVRFNKSRVPVTLGLPFIAGVLVSAGALVAGLVAFVAFGLPEVARRVDRTQPIDWVSVRRRVFAGVTLVVLAGATVHLVSERFGADSAVHRMLEALAFVLLYGVFYESFHIRAVEAGAAQPQRAGLTLIWLRYGLFALLAVQVAVLVSDRAYMFIPALFIPVLVLRRALALRARMYEHYEESMIALNLMLQRTHEYSQGHLDRVASMAEEVGLLLGLTDRRARLLREAALLHDIGKVAIDEAILDKPAALTEEEFVHVRRHAEFGAIILDQAEHFRPIATWVRHHHERPDGKGYPDGLVGEEIPIESRIIAVTDAFDAMVGGPNPRDRRAYRDPMTPDEALAELRRCAGTQFDRLVVEAFGEVLKSRGYVA